MWQEIQEQEGEEVVVEGEEEEEDAVEEEEEGVVALEAVVALVDVVIERAGTAGTVEIGAAPMILGEEVEEMEIEQHLGVTSAEIMSKVVIATGAQACGEEIVGIINAGTMMIGAEEEAAMEMRTIIRNTASVTITPVSVEEGLTIDSHKTNCKI
eukprot:m.60197 g.60197  ORF g.60197 m.60197 type:complete len:155 (+) comp11358_c0_seq6:335-799(+)